MTIGSARSKTRPRKRLPASVATSIKYGNELLDTRSVPSRSAAMDWYAVPLQAVIGGNFLSCFVGDMVTVHSKLSLSLCVTSPLLYSLFAVLKLKEEREVLF